MCQLDVIEKSNKWRKIHKEGISILRLIFKIDIYFFIYIPSQSINCSKIKR
jgi:hypothetical protein